MVIYKRKFSSGSSGSGVSGCFLYAFAFENLQSLHPYSIRLIGVATIWHQESICSGAPNKVSIYSGIPVNIVNCNSRLQSQTNIWTVAIISLETVQVHIELHPPRPCTTSISISPAILLPVVLYILLMHSLPNCRTVYLHYSKWNLCLGRWWITIHRRLKKHTFRAHSYSRQQPTFIVNQMFAIQLSPFGHRMAKCLPLNYLLCALYY